MHQEARTRLARFRRRAHFAAFVGGFSLGLATLLLVAVAWLVTARIAAWPMPRADATWLLLLLAPLAYGVWRAVRTALPPLTQAAHLDRRLGLDGLLLTAAETDAAPWQDALAARLAATRARGPQIRWSLFAKRIVPPALLLAGVCWLPQTTPPSPFVNRSIAQALEDLEAMIELAKQEGLLPEEKLAELAQRADELKQGMERGKDATWSDVDQLQARLQQERVLQRDALQKTAHGAKAMQAAARNAGEQSESGSAPDLDAQMRELLQHAAAAGLLGKLPSDVDPTHAAKAGDAEAFAQLAEALAQAALEQVEALPGMPEEDLEDLAELLRDMQGDGQGLGRGPGEGVGRGGVERGPGHATLELNENFDGDASALQAHKLPPGRVLPQDWEVMQTSRVDPEVAPTRNVEAGGTAAAGAGEAAWRRRLSPTHRAVVHEFFSGRRNGTPDKR